MLKKMSLRKITVSSLALIILSLFYFFPTNFNSLQIKENISYNEVDPNDSVFLLDKYDYVSKTDIYIEKENIEDIVKEKIEYLTINSNKTSDIPNGFRSLIPDGTKILNLELKEKILSINFSKEFLNIEPDKEEALIEAITYSLTGQQIEGIKILVEGKLLTNLPTSKKILPEVINRNYGINKEYDITSLSDISKTVVYYINNINDNIYYTPVTKVTNESKEKIMVIIDELKSSLIYQSNLSSYLNSTAELKKYEIKEGVMNLTFNENIFDSIDSKNIIEEIKYTIYLSVMDNYDVKSVEFYKGEEKF